MRIAKWPSFMGRATHKDSNKIKFVFLEVSTNFYEFWKFEPISRIFKQNSIFERNGNWFLWPVG
jgi:hypothetical protein